MVFVRPPVNLRRPGCIWRLRKALYGLRQSPRLFQEFLAEALGQPGWVRCVVEPQLWFHLRTGAMLTAHADDLMLATPPGAREEIMHNLESKMRIKWGECLKVGVKSEWVRFLGKEMRRTETGYELRIPLGYMKGILELLHLEKTKGAPTPFLSIKPTEEPQLCDMVEHHLYRQVVGKMMWLASDRPDLTYAIKELARAVQQPNVEDMQKLKRLGKYLANTLDMVWRLDVDMKQSLAEVRVITDANWAAAPDRRSTSGGWITVANFPILHYSRTQSDHAEHLRE